MGSSDRLPDLKVRETFTISEQTKQAVAVAGCAPPGRPLRHHSATHMNLSSSKERSPRATRAAGEVCLNSIGTHGLQADRERQADDLSAALPLDKGRELKSRRGQRES